MVMIKLYILNTKNVAKVNSIERNNSMIKYIIFDLSEVIITGYYGTEKRIAKLLGLDEKEVNSILKGKNFFNLMLGEITEEEYINDILKQTNWDISLDEFKNVIRENHNQEIKGTMEIIKELSEKYELVLLSDHVKEWIEDILEKNKSLEVFNKKYFSYELKNMKSSQETFRNVLEDLGANANQALFIDDSKRNVEVATLLGIESIIFENAVQLREELEYREVL